MKIPRNIFISFCLLMLFCIYQTGITMFSHVHYVNGVMIVHSHPSTENQHAHTEMQVITLAQVAAFIGLEPAQTFVEVAPIPFCQTLEYNHHTSFISTSYVGNVCLRAPPVCSWI